MAYVAVCAFSVSSALQAQWVEEPSYLCVQYLAQDMPSTLLRHFSSSPSFVVVLVLSRSSYQTIANQIASACVPWQYRVRVLARRYNCTLSSMLVQTYNKSYYNTKLLQLSASSWLLRLLTVFGPDAAITTTVAPMTHRWCWLLRSRHRPLSK